VGWAGRLLDIGGSQHLLVAMLLLARQNPAISSTGIALTLAPASAGCWFSMLAPRSGCRRNRTSALSLRNARFGGALDRASAHLQ
jgi:hypothetical protein